jgi:NAD(P)-dependent dehydrogenase (short-subunit alcohol dehydrogenase family)
MGMAGRIVAVTGASQGIGFEAALAFARAGDVVIATSRDASGARTAFVGHDIETPIDVVELDVTEQSSVDDFVGYLQRRYGRLDVLVNNAGRAFRGTLAQLSIDDLQRSLDVNFLGAARLTKAVLPMMRAARSGHLIAVSSMGGAFGQPFRDAYCAAKFALEGLYESMQPVEAMFGVHVSIVQPGPVASDHDARGFAAETGEDAELAAIEAHYLTAQAAGRAQTAEAAAAPILACADDPSPALRYQTSGFARALIGRKLADMSGEVITTMTRSWIDPEFAAAAAR